MTKTGYFFIGKSIYCDMLKVKSAKYYKVKKGQTVAKIARFFCVSERALVKENALNKEVEEGQILRIPMLCGNAYTATPSDTKSKLCGTDENFIKKNGAPFLYPGMRVIL